MTNSKTERVEICTQQRILRRYAVILICLMSSIVLTGCPPSMRQDGLKVAQFGSTTAKQMVEFYGSLQKDTVDTYELNAFRKAYIDQRARDRAQAKGETLPAQSPSDLEMDRELERKIRAEYRKTYDALEARRQLSRAMQAAYDNFEKLNAYDASDDIKKSVGKLSSAVEAASKCLLIDLSGTVSSVVQALFTGILQDLATIQGNKAIEGESEKLARILNNLRGVFDAEMILYGGDSTVKDSTGKERNIRGIAGARAAAYKEVSLYLVESDAVISTAMINRVLGQYDLRWPEPQKPFTQSQSAMKSGIIQMIEARAVPIVQLTEDAGAGISRSLEKLSAMHRQLAVKKPLSLQEAMDNSATVQVLLDQLTARTISTGGGTR